MTVPVVTVSFAMSPERRQELIDQASDLFYDQGIAATGATQLARELRISKQTLYEAFGSKDGLVTAVLEAADRTTFEHFTLGAEQRAADPAARILVLFELLADVLASPGARGCRFVNAAVELADSGHPGREVVASHKARLAGWFERQARRAGLRRPRALGRQLVMLFDGASAQPATLGRVDARHVIDAAQALVDAAR